MRRCSRTILLPLSPVQLLALTYLYSQSSWTGWRVSPRWEREKLQCTLLVTVDDFVGPGAFVRVFFFFSIFINVVYQHPAHSSPPYHLPTLTRVFSTNTNRGSNSKTQIILAIEAIHTSKKLNRRSAAKAYKTLESTLRLKMNGHTSLRERRPATHKLTESEEKVILRYIFDLDSKGFAPRLAGMEELLESRGG